MNYSEQFLRHIESWTDEILADKTKLNAWIAATDSTANARKDALIDDLLGESKAGKSGQILTGKSGTVTWEWEDASDWQDAHERSKY